MLRFLQPVWKSILTIASLALILTTLAHQVQATPTAIIPAPARSIALEGTIEKTSLGQPQDSLCFYQQSNGQILDLSRLCGMQTQNNSQTVINPSQPIDSPYNYELLKQYDNQLYGQEK